MNEKTTDLVSQVYPDIDWDTLDELDDRDRGESRYWGNCKEFWDQVHNMPCDQLKPKQKVWLDKIAQACKNFKEEGYSH